MNKPLRLIELFAGYGSQALALEYLNIPYESWFVCDFDKYAIQSYNDIHNTNYKSTDITKITSNDLNIIETNKHDYLLTYSFPCTDLSNAGKQAGMQKGSGTRSGLLWEVERLLKECKELPQYLLMENVPQVIGKKNINDFKNWCQFLTELGYTNSYKLLNAKDYGIPQNRNRCFMVSILNDKKFKFPDKQPLKLRLKDILEDNVDEKYYLKNYQLENFLKLGNVNPGGKGISGIVNDWNIINTLTASDYKQPKLILVGDLKYFARDDMNRVYSENGLSPTSTTRCANINIMDNTHAIRKLTSKECLRLMGVKDKEINKFTVSDSQKYKQAGNSIVVNVLMAIFKNLFIDEKYENTLF